VDVDLAGELAAIIGQVLRIEPVVGGDICRAYQVSTSEARYFVKSPRQSDKWMLPVEAAGLQALGDVVPGLTPSVVHAESRFLVLEWVAEQGPSRNAAAALGERLAALHAHPAPVFGHGPEHGRIGPLPMACGQYESWPQMYAELRLRPLLNDRTPRSRDLVDALMDDPEWAGPLEPPSLLHGDLWSGNVVWSMSPRLVDPAAHVGHRETDLAMLALFGTPYLETILTAYQQVYPLAPGWQARVGLHQMWPLLVHARLFGGRYAQRAEVIATGYLQG
jgi:fructosamine-3-kinase